MDQINTRACALPQPKLVGEFNGELVHEITLTGPDGSSCRILTWGAVIADLRVKMPDGPLQSVVLGFEKFEDYPKYSPYFGAVVGRYANRISGGGFTLDGQRYTLDQNEGPNTCLHGGAGGLSQRVWTIDAYSKESVTLGLHSPDGDQGFPGALDVKCTYTLSESAILSLEFNAVSTQSTIVNLSQHSYFNLDGSGSISDHRLTVIADRITPVDSALIPSGESLNVQGTPFDFMTPRPVSAPQCPMDLDHNFILTRPENLPVTQGSLAAILETQKTGLTMQIYTTKPGLQVYDGHQLNVPIVGLNGQKYGPRSGICLEPQFFPDSPNQPAFPSAQLAAGEIYAHSIEYRFSCI
ncbi:aldose epimerase family protein [Falsihalocynthiibacter sp. BN13B15]|uniref:aldose epimerase family protein n=1 Tax=Falsihalocynthiibacter sp. BN13B15 TaxID=3240871 RepID=UPI00350EC2D4